MAARWTPSTSPRCSLSAPTPEYQTSSAGTRHLHMPTRASSSRPVIAVPLIHTTTAPSGPRAPSYPRRPPRLAGASSASRARMRQITSALHAQAAQRMGPTRPHVPSPATPASSPTHKANACQAAALQSTSITTSALAADSGIRQQGINAKNARSPTTGLRLTLPASAARTGLRLIGRAPYIDSSAGCGASKASSSTLLGTASPSALRGPTRLLAVITARRVPRGNSTMLPPIAAIPARGATTSPSSTSRARSVRTRIQQHRWVQQTSQTVRLNALPGNI